MRIELEETSCWSFDWANSEVIAIGTTNGQFFAFSYAYLSDLIIPGVIAIYNIASEFKVTTSAGTCSPSPVIRVAWLIPLPPPPL